MRLASFSSRRIRLRSARAAGSHRGRKRCRSTPEYTVRSFGRAAGYSAAMVSPSQLLTVTMPAQRSTTACASWAEIFSGPNISLCIESMKRAPGAARARKETIRGRLYTTTRSYGRDIRKSATPW